MLKLYYNAMSRAARVRWMLEEVGAPYELVQMDFDSGDCEKPEFLKVHPLGVVPAIEDGDFQMFESGAICAYLADRYPGKELAPAPGTDARGHYYQWMFFVFAELEQPVVEIFAQTQWLDEAERTPKNLTWAQEQLTTRAAVIEKHLEGKQWLLGDHFTAADVVMASLLMWATMGGVIKGHPNIEAYCKRCASRPAAKRAMPKE